MAKLSAVTISRGERARHAAQKKAGPQSGPASLTGRLHVWETQGPSETCPSFGHCTRNWEILVTCKIVCNVTESYLRKSMPFNQFRFGIPAMRQVQIYAEGRAAGRYGETFGSSGMAKKGRTAERSGKSNREASRLGDAGPVRDVPFISGIAPETGKSGECKNVRNITGDLFKENDAAEPVRIRHPSHASNAWLTASGPPGGRGGRIAARAVRAVRPRAGKKKPDQKVRRV